MFDGTIFDVNYSIKDGLLFWRVDLWSLTALLWWLKLCKNSILPNGSFYHPETGEQIQVLNKTLKMYLFCFALENPRSWFSMLPW